MTGASTADTVPTIRVLDMINTDRSMRELLVDRVAQVNATGRYHNELLCSAGAYVDDYRARGFTIHVINTPRGLSPWGLLSGIWKTVRLLRKERFDIVHTHGSVIWLVGGVAAWLARVPCVVHQIHGFHHHEAMGRLKRSLYLRLERFLSRFADRLLFQNQSDLDNCVRRRVAPREKLIRIGNGIQLDRFREDPSAADDHEATGPDSSGRVSSGRASSARPENGAPTPVILCVGRFEPVKNHMMLLRAVKRLADRGISFTLQLAGDGELRCEYEAWARQNGLADRVAFLGYRDDIPEITAGADVCVLVSHKEGLPRAIIEAGACAKPVVATDVIGNAQTVIDGETGFLVPLDDDAALARRLEELLLDDALRRRMGRRARAHVAEHYDERSVTQRIIDVYDRAACTMGVRTP